MQSLAEKIAYAKENNNPTALDFVLETIIGFDRLHGELLRMTVTKYDSSGPLNRHYVPSPQDGIYNITGIFKRVKDTSEGRRQAILINGGVTYRALVGDIINVEQAVVETRRSDG